MRLSALVEAIDDEVVRRPDEDPEVTAVTHDSRSVTPGALFCCVPGGTTDGHDHAGAAVAAGAVALLVERPLEVDGAAQVQVADVRRAMAPVAARLHGEPSRDLLVAGVTGTNGKTTVVHLLAETLSAAGVSTAPIGTLTGARTTPEAPELQAILATLRDDGRSAVAMEVSSHALALHRADATWFEVAVFTNLSQDHLDFHGTMEEYFEAKALLFQPDRCGRAVVSVDDAWGVRLADRIESSGGLPLVRCSLDEVADLHVGLRRCSFRWRDQVVAVPLGGRHNASNALLAAEAAVALGLDPAAVAAGLSEATPVPGRFEVVDAGQELDVVVDYAHTPDGLDKLLSSVRAAVEGRVIVVFGCGGDRDRDKRPLMGRAAVAGADLAIVTSDNPRSEDPQAIIEAVTDGISDLRSVVVEPDRRAAIALAIDLARPDDVVVIAGKGHETTQEVAGVRTPFDDRLVAAELLGQVVR